MLLTFSNVDMNSTRIENGVSNDTSTLDGSKLFGMVTTNSKPPLSSDF